MSETDAQKTIAIIQSTEEVADKILVNKHELLALGQRRQQTREAMRAMEKEVPPQKNSA